MMEPKVGAVVIGRNEGERLQRCLTSVSEQVNVVIYVDSGSTDDSIPRAQDIGVHIVELDMTVPFTAARARNEGASRLLEKEPQLHYLQFIDGDCELVAGWVPAAVAFLESRVNYAIACGRRSELFPELSVYNTLCDIEWDTPIGDADACGGDALIRVSSFSKVNGYCEDLIAGEEPEMCFRMRHHGWKIARMDMPMTLHDAAMYNFGQWWQRSRRAGFAYMAGAYLHGASAERFCVRNVRSIVLWAVIIPLICLLAAIVSPVFLLGFLIYPVQICRLAIKGSRSAFVNLQWALYIVVGNFPQLLGVVKFWQDRFSGRASKLIEYK